MLFKLIILIHNFFFKKKYFSKNIYELIIFHKKILFRIILNLESIEDF
ncbi:hypothetical protein QF023_002591 [Chryseobacterium sp. SLBN-27]|nr:hypothetical protein [Chryseobacterium sp. SLBN-27]